MPPTNAGHAHTNALAQETSPYLLQHAHNPVDWRPWGPEAFEEAKRRGVPIFLSIGYSTCYWCHVMERQVFEDPAMAGPLNERFVCIKVDREERPDLDDIYMTATQLMTQRGGWPMSVFLTPPGARGPDDRGLEPFWCGTYIPPQPMHGLPSFPQVVEALSRAYREQHGEVLEQAKRLAEAVRRTLALDRAPGAQAPLTGDSVQATVDQLLQMHDAQHGGFGGAPKFPQPANLGLLLRVHAANPHEAVWGVVTQTLDRMARGGVFDQIGGGFHRYAVDAQWAVPHFEKMLYDNAQLLEVYAGALDQKPEAAEARQWERVIRETAGYVLREMVDPSGAFWSAQDAEVQAREGGSYVWQEDEVRAALEDEGLAEVARVLYGLDGGPNFQDPHAPDAEPASVLLLPKPIERLAERLGLTPDELLEKRSQINRRLLAARDRREQPATDDKVLTGWNGLMIAGLAAAGRVLSEPRYLDAARSAADAVWTHMRGDGGGLLRTMRRGRARVPAFLEDYAFYAHGLLALHRATGDDELLGRVREVVEAAAERFAAPGGGYYDTLADQSDLFVRTRSSHDGATPSGNSQMVHDLLDLHEATGERRWLDRAAGDLQSFAGALDRLGAGMVHMQHALLRALGAGVGAEMPGKTRGGGEASAAGGPVSLRVEPAGLVLSEQREVTVIVDIAPGHHLIAQAGRGAAAPKLAWNGPPGVALEPRWPEPRPRDVPVPGGQAAVYARSVTLTVGVSADAEALADGPLEGRLVLRYQACDDTACRPEATASAELRIAP